MWRVLRDELHDQGVELITVGLDSLGVTGCQDAIKAAAPNHPALIDSHHLMARLFGVVNIPQSVWIDEQGMIVRPVTSAPPPSDDSAEQPPPDIAALPERMLEIMGEAMQIESDPKTYHDALRDWVTHGANSRYALSPEIVIARSQPATQERALGDAHFELACEAVVRGRKSLAIAHFQAAHRLVPDSWTYRRQAWSLETVDAAGPFARFWQGPHPDHPEDWPYEGDWLSDIRASGPANYYDPWKA